MTDLRAITDGKREAKYAAAVTFVSDHPNEMDVMVKRVQRWLDRAREAEDATSLYWFTQWEMVLRDRDMSAIRRFGIPSSPYERGMLISSPLFLVKAAQTSDGPPGKAVMSPVTQLHR